jgi:beta-glucosidase
LYGILHNTMQQDNAFLWGAATSAHQVEGHAIHNDWWEWEKRTAGIERSGKAADHYNRFREDFALAQQLRHNAHRFSIEWSRIEPAQGKFHRGATDHYRQVLMDLRERNMKTFVTLHHFTNPLWLARRGGWTHKETPELFKRYTHYIVQHLGDLVDFWITINEPMVYATQSYWEKRWPPQERSIRKMWKVIRRMARAHRLAYRTIHQTYPDARVGIAKHLVAYLPERIGQIDDQVVARAEDWWFNHYFFSLIGNAQDFIGVNYYFARKKRVHVFPPTISNLPWGGPTTDMGWPIAPHGLTHVLLHMKRYGKPIYITENGLADADDSRRANFIRDHLRAVEKAQAAGADVRGYLHWSLLDNFEWSEGFAPRFGLVEVDYKTLKRSIRPSAYVYKAIIEQARRMV